MQLAWGPPPARYHRARLRSLAAVWAKFVLGVDCDFGPALIGARFRYSVSDESELVRP